MHSRDRARYSWAGGASKPPRKNSQDGVMHSQDGAMHSWDGAMHGQGRAMHGQDGVIDAQPGWSNTWQDAGMHDWDRVMHGRAERCTAKTEQCTAGWKDAQQDGGMHGWDGGMHGRTEGCTARTQCPSQMDISERYPARMILVRYGGTHGWAGIASRVLIGVQGSEERSTTEIECASDGDRSPLGTGG